MKYILLLLTLTCGRAVGQTKEMWASASYFRILPSKEWRINFQIDRKVYIEGGTILTAEKFLRSIDEKQKPLPADKVDTVRGIAITYSNDSIPAYLITPYPGIKDCYGCAMMGSVHVDLTGNVTKITQLDFPEPVYDLNFKPLVRNTIERFYIPVRKLGF